MPTFVRGVPPPQGIIDSPIQRRIIIRYGVQTTPVSSTAIGEFSATGRRVFHTLSWILTLCWMLLAPMLTATSIAGERERGLLESLQLSSLSPTKVVAGKLLATLSFLSLMLLVPMPIVAICFMMGGVAPDQFLLSLLVQVVTAITSAMLGLCASAWSRRSSIAVRAALIGVLVWAVGSGLSFRFWSNWYLPQASWYHEIIDTVTGIVGQANPVVAVASISNMGMLAGTQFAAPTLNNAAAPPWVVSLVVQTILALTLFHLAERGVNRELAAPAWLERSMWLKLLESFVPRPTRPQRPTSQSDADSLGEAGRVETSEPLPQWRHNARRAMWRDIIVLPPLRFSNPMMQREFRGKFRWRVASPLMGVALAFAGLWFLISYVTALASIMFEDRVQREVWWKWTMIWLLIVTTSTGIMGACSLVREREGGTWEALKLSLLAPGEVLGAKIGGAALACVLYSCAFLPLLIPCIHTSVSYIAGERHGVTIYEAAGTFLIVGAMAWMGFGFGLWLSARCRSTVSAVGWTIGILFLVYVMIPVLATSFIDSGWRSYSTTPPAMRALRDWNPYAAMFCLSNGTYLYQLQSFGSVSLTQSGPPAALGTVLPFVRQATIVGCFFLALAYWKIARDLRGRNSETPAAKTISAPLLPTHTNENPIYSPPARK